NIQQAVRHGSTAIAQQTSGSCGNSKILNCLSFIQPHHIEVYLRNMVFADSIQVRALVLIIDNLVLIPTLEFNFDC
ncbi:MAG: hypothetical protein QNL55_08205, partial [Euryarchaeota archaeon]